MTTSKNKGKLYLIRGLPGSGKTTLAKTLCHSFEYPYMVCTDDFFYDQEGNYKFDPTKLSEAHECCKLRVEIAMLKEEDGLKFDAIIVHNTFSQPWESAPYFALAEKFGYSVFVIECQNKFQNIHDVPQRSIDDMRSRWLPLN